MNIDIKHDTAPEHNHPVIKRVQVRPTTRRVIASKRNKRISRKSATFNQQIQDAINSIY